MSTTNSVKPEISKSTFWAGVIISGLPSIFLVVDSIIKFLKPPEVLKISAQLGIGESLLNPLGVVLLTCTILYMIPRTTILGAILLTGYLGGASATHVLHWEGWFPVFFPIIIGILLWGGIFLRYPGLRELIPFRK